MSIITDTANLPYPFTLTNEGLNEGRAAIDLVRVAHCWRLLGKPEEAYEHARHSQGTLRLQEWVSSWFDFDVAASLNSWGQIVIEVEASTPVTPQMAAQVEAFVNFTLRLPISSSNWEKDLFVSVFVTKHVPCLEDWRGYGYSTLEFYNGTGDGSPFVSLTGRNPWIDGYWEDDTSPSYPGGETLADFWEGFKS